MFTLKSSAHFDKDMTGLGLLFLSELGMKFSKTASLLFCSISVQIRIKAEYPDISECFKIPIAKQQGTGWPCRSAHPLPRCPGQKTEVFKRGIRQDGSARRVLLRGQRASGSGAAPEPPADICVCLAIPSHFCLFLDVQFLI